MSREHHEPQVQEVEGTAEEIIGKIAKLLFDKHVRYLELKLESEGTLYYEGKLICRF